MRTASDLERVEAHCTWWEDTVSAASDPWRFGTVLTDDRFPDRWDSNVLRVDRPLDGADAGTLAEYADRLLARFRHREVVVLDDEEGGRLEPGFRELGWEVDHLVYMIQLRAPERAPLPIETREIDLETIRPLIVETNVHGHGGMPVPDAEMLAGFRRVLIERLGARFFTALLDGEPAGYCELYVHDGVAQIEDVNTLERFRNRGAARAFVSRAIDEGRAVGGELVFLVADANDWPRRLYGSMGFDPVGHRWQFTRPPAGSTYR
jgi:GNAT superfamily N-acetyltransferase